MKENDWGKQRWWVQRQRGEKHSRYWSSLHPDSGIDIRAISACHPLPREDKTKLAIALQFVNRKVKNNLLQQAKNLRGSVLYLNKHLNQKNADISRHARALKKPTEFQATCGLKQMQQQRKQKPAC